MSLVRASSKRLALGVSLLLGLGACAGSTQPPDTLEGLALIGVEPGLIVPGTRVSIEGRSFVHGDWADSHLVLVGTFTSDGETSHVDARIPVEFEDFDHMNVTADGEFFAAIGGDDGEFSGQGSIEIWFDDSRVYETAAIPVSLRVATEISPGLDTVTPPGLTFVNSRIEVDGVNLLLGGDEGETMAVLEGCFTPNGADACTDISPIALPVAATNPFDRTHGSFLFGPEVVGIVGGSFQGQVSLRNDHLAGGSPTSATSAVDFALLETTVLDITPKTVSLGQYVFIEGGGFVGTNPGNDDADIDSDHVTLLQLVGTFTPTGGAPAPVDILLIPTFVDGDRIRYVMSESDELGRSVDLRKDTGVFEGDVVPQVTFEGTSIEGNPSAFTLEIAPVRQVVYLDFTHLFVETLRHFGLRAIDDRVIQRVVDVVERDYATINVDVRTEPPTDFVHFTIVEIGGPDPNGLGLLGYDNTPGKDTGNERLFDKIGGGNATTQDDGYPGFGGVFIQSLFAFSEHPGSLADGVPGADPSFDLIFDPFRPDRGGAPVRAADLSANDVALSDGSSCPADDRETQVKCAVWVLGSLIGTTLSHELGHSLGLANPFGSTFHNPFDETNRLMDSGGSRPFTERAELFGDGPALFCDEEYDYLRRLMPTNEPADTRERPGCF